MKISPSYQLSILSEEEYTEKMPAICAQLDQFRCSGTFSGFDGESLYYEYFQAQESRGAIVIVHGLSEFTEKYQEFSWYLLNQGYDVFLFDQRSHGRSCRLTPRKDLIHVESFKDYVKDLEQFLSQVVNKATDGPLYLYAHSMGGATALRFLAKHPDVFRKALLSAPMIEPITAPTPPFVARVGLSLYLLFGDKKKKFWFSNEYDPQHPFEKAQDQSYARFKRNLDLRNANEAFRTTPLSIRWVQQSVLQKRTLTSKTFLKKIQTPILMLSAQNDRLVCSKAQAKFARNCPLCRQVTIPDTTHAMLSGPEHTLQQHMQLLMDHFR